MYNFWGAVVLRCCSFDLLRRSAVVAGVMVEDFVAQECAVEMQVDLGGGY